MSGLAEQLRPEDVPVGLGSPGGPLLLVATGIVMTVSPERATDAVRRRGRRSCDLGSGLSRIPPGSPPRGPPTPCSMSRSLSTDTKPVDHLAGCSAALASLRPRHRQAALDAVAAGRLTPSDAMANVDAVRLLDRQAHHAWLAVAYLPGVTG